MSVNDLILLVLVAAGAFYAGYQIGRFKALSERGAAGPSEEDQPLPGPRAERPYSEASVPSRPRAAPPPASAGEESDGSRGRMPPRRSSKPPPAAAGLMGTGETEKSGTRQK